MTTLGAKGDKVRWATPPLVKTDSGVVPAPSCFAEVAYVYFGKIFCRFWIPSERQWSTELQVSDDRVPQPWSGNLNEDP